MDFLEKILGYVMRGIYWLCPNYIVSLILFALVFQLILLPLGIKQQKNMIKQAAIRPLEMAIRKKYAGRNDQVTMRKMQNELLELQQKNGFSPMAGCLPMIVQMIIIFPLYWIVIRPLQYCGGLTYSQCWSLAKELGIEMAETKQYGLQPVSTTFQIDIANALQDGWRPQDQGLLDAVNGMIDSRLGIPSAGVLGNTPFSGLGNGLWWLIFIPIVNLALTYLSQFISKKLSYQSVQQETQAGGSMKIMMYVLPLMTFFITANFASAIGIYWIVRTLLSMLQQFILAKTMPYPKFTEDDYKKAEKEYKKGNTSPASEKVYSDKPYRSLHHIDDDDE